MVGACASQRANGARSQGWGCPPLFPNAQSWLITASSQDQRNFTQLYSACCQNTIIIGLTGCDSQLVMVAMTRRPQKKRKLILVGEDFLEYPRFPSFCHPFETKFCLEVEEKIKEKGQHHTPIWMKKPDKVLKALQALKPLFTRTAMDFTAGPCVQIQILQVLEYF